MNRKSVSWAYGHKRVERHFRILPDGDGWMNRDGRGSLLIMALNLRLVRPAKQPDGHEEVGRPSQITACREAEIQLTQRIGL